MRSQRDRLAASEGARTVPALTAQPGTWEPAEISEADEETRPRGGDMPASAEW